jgi:hypothetical protein
MFMNTKFFKTVDETGFYSLYACHADTPIPTMKEIVERDSLSPFCLTDRVEEISMEEFLQLHNETLAEIADSANDMVEWSPNGGSIKSWEWWFSAEEWEYMEG